MDIPAATLALYAIGAAALVTSLGRIKTRLELSKAKHPSLSGHSRMARRVARLIPFYEYDEARFFASDDAPEDVVRTRRAAAFDRAAYTAWLQQLRTICSERGIVLIFDEVFVGFRLAPGGAQEYFGIKADIVTYGKTLGGGLPVGVVCGRADLMKRFRDDRPADICFARGTFNAHPYVMGSMHEFLKALETPEVRAIYTHLDATWDGRTAILNERLAAADLPVRVANLSSIWTVFYTRPSRYNWMLQYYLRAEGIALSWVGTGRLIWSLNYSAADFEAVALRFVAAARAMQEDGWWWSAPAATNKSIRRRILRELLGRRG